MLTESRLDHIESLVKRAKNFTYQDPLGDTLKEVRSTSLGVLLTALSLLIGFYFSTSAVSIVMMSFLWVVGAVSMITFIVSFFIYRRIKSQKEEPYNGCLDEIIDILRKFRDSFKSP